MILVDIPLVQTLHIWTVFQARLQVSLDRSCRILRWVYWIRRSHFRGPQARCPLKCYIMPEVHSELYVVPAKKCFHITEARNEEPPYFLWGSSYLTYSKSTRETSSIQLIKAISKREAWVFSVFVITWSGFSTAVLKRTSNRTGAYGTIRIRRWVSGFRFLTRCSVKLAATMKNILVNQGKDIMR